MKKRKMCYVTNIAAHYRSAIYLLMDNAFDMDFIFGDHPSDMKFDVSQLKNSKVVLNNTQLTKSVYYQKGVPFLFTKYDIILITGETHCLSTWLLLFFSFFSKNTKVYLWSHGWYGKESKIESVVKKVFFGMANGVFVYSDRAKQLMIKQGLRADRIFPIHNSLDYEKQLAVRANLSHTDLYESHFHNKNHNIIFIGRLTPVKKLDMILHALIICRSKGWDYNLTFVGDGSMRGELESLAHQLGLRSQIWFYGACVDELINGQFIFNADICVSPGNVGLTAIHCLTYGTPVITHNDLAHQMPEVEVVKQGVTGDLFNNGDINSLAECIMNWFDHSKDRDTIRKECYDLIASAWTPSYQLKVLKDHLL